MIKFHYYSILTTTIIFVASLTAMFSLVDSNTKLSIFELNRSFNADIYVNQLHLAKTKPAASANTNANINKNNNTISNQQQQQRDRRKDKPDNPIVSIEREEQEYLLMLESLKCNLRIYGENNSTGYAPKPNNCPAYFDTVLCWPETPANQTVYENCPDYVDKFNTKS